MERKIKYLLALMSSVLIALLVLSFSLFFGEKNIQRDFPELIKQVIPNLIASLLVFLALYLFVEQVLRESPLNPRLFGSLYDDYDKLLETGEAISARTLKEQEARLEKERESLVAEIAKELEKMKRNADDGNRVELNRRLSDLYLKASIIDKNVTAIAERLRTSNELDARDAQILQLRQKVASLEKTIESHKLSAQTIVETAQKI